MSGKKKLPAVTLKRPEGRRAVVLRREIQNLVERYAKRHGITPDTAANELIRAQFVEAQQ